MKVHRKPLESSVWKTMQTGVSCSVSAASLVFLLSGTVLSAQEQQEPPVAKPEAAEKAATMGHGGKKEHKCKAAGGGCGHMQKGHGDTPGKMSGGRMGGGHMAAMGPIHELIDNHQNITREVEDLKDGVLTVTRSTDPDLVPTLQKHVGQMVEMLESGGSIRHWDPLFVKIFENADKIEVRTELIPDGIRVWETSSDPYVAKLIQAHAAKVSEFAERGRDAMHEPTAVPEG